MKKTLLATCMAMTFIFNTSASEHADARCNLFKNAVTDNESISFNNFYNKDKTKEKFEQIAGRVVSLYSDTVKELGGNLKLTLLWDSNELNAYAQKDQTNWEVIFHGALYKDRRITDDGFALTVCHEIGHLLGGAPFKLGQNTSAEGQADFWASSVCIKKYFQQYPTEVAIKDGTAKKSCDAKYAGDKEAQKICYRGTQAGLSLALFVGLASEGRAPNFDFPDKRTPLITNQLHPNSQCRLDTFLSGSLCVLEDTSVAFEEKLLTDKLITDYRCTETVDGQLVQLEKRPKCWFNELNNSVFANYEAKVDAKGLFSFTKGKIYISYFNHLPGEYKIKLVNDNFSGAYVKISTGEYVTNLPASGEVNNLVFEYNFIRNTHSEQKFVLIVEHDGKVILKQDAGVILKPK